MSYWLLKTEPDEYSIDDIAKQDVFCWDEIRNYQARNFIRDQVKQGDLAFIYHSSCKQVGIAGVVEIVTDAKVEQAQFDPQHPKFDPKSTQNKPKWYSFDIRFKQKFNRVIPLSWIKQQAELNDMVLIKQGRLSVQPVSEQQWQFITSRAK